MLKLNSGRASVSRSLSVVVPGVLVVVMGVVVWARDRGFDLTDEGNYLQLYAHPESAPPDAVSQFYRLIDSLTGWAEIGLVGYRVLALILLLVSGGFFWFAIARFARTWLPGIVMPPLVASVSFVAVAGLLGYSWAPLAVSYSTLSAALVYVVAGLILLALAGSTGSKKTRWQALNVVLAGGALPFLLYVKWPAAVLLVLALFVLVPVVLGRAGLRALAIMGASGLAVFSLITEELLGGLFSIDAVFDAAGFVSSSHHPPTEIVKNYLLWIVGDTVRVLWQDTFRLVALVLLFVGGSLGVIGRARFGWIRVWMFPVVGGAYLVAEIPGASYLDREINFKLVVALTLALGLSLFIAQIIRTGQLPDFSVRKLSQAGRLVWVLVTFSLVLPFVAAVGSNSHILTTSLYGGAGYGAAAVVGVAALRHIAGDEAELSFSIALPVLAVVFAAQIVNGVVVDPYRLVSSRLEQTSLVPGIPRLEGIRFDDASGDFLSEVNRLVYEETSFVPGDRVLAFSSIPGLVYMIDGTFPGSVWIRPPESGEQGSICSVLRSFPDQVADTRLILQNSPPSPELAACLEELLSGYPERFVEVGGVRIPDDYGAGTSSGDTLKVFESRP